MFKPKPKSPKHSDVIVESVSEVGSEKEHILKTIFDGPEEDIPEITSIGYMCIKGTKKCISYVIKSKGREITKIEVSEPDLWPIAEEAARCSFVDRFMYGNDNETH